MYRFHVEFDDFFVEKGKDIVDLVVLPKHILNKLELRKTPTNARKDLQ